MLRSGRRPSLNWMPLALRRASGRPNPAERPWVTSGILLRSHLWFELDVLAVGADPGHGRLSSAGVAHSMYTTFSDGSPVVELLIFCATFAACLTLAQWKPAASAIDRVLGRTAVFLRKRIFLIDDVDTEQRRLDLIRIVFGLVTLFGILEISPRPWSSANRSSSWPQPPLPC